MSKLFIFLGLIQVNYGFTDVTKPKRVCVIGAGLVGLSAARYLKEERINFTVFEATRYIGGTWRYDPRTGTDEYGLPIYTSMYKDLRTNLPKPAMEFPGFPLQKSLPSFLPQKDFYSYIQDYAKHFNIVKHIKFLHNVILVRRKNDKWTVKYENVVTHEVFEEKYDYVLVANGHFSVPNKPEIRGENMFKGTVLHSHDYREAEPYKDRRVLVIGAGPSGMDIAKSIVEVSTVLIHSHHRVQNSKPFPPNYIKKPDIKEFNETGAIFVDGTYEDVDDVVYCSGYKFDFPFLEESCGLTLKPQVVYPLYQRMVNIREPSMFIMGLVATSTLVNAFHAQARYVTALIKGNFTLPSQHAMMQEWEKEMAIITTKKLRPSFLHILGEKENDYYAALSAESGIFKVPPVLSKIRAATDVIRTNNFYTFRDYEFIVVDENTFISRLEKKTIEH